MAKKIEVTPEVRAQLREEHCLENDTTVYKALNYETNSPLAKMIRRRALELGGKFWLTSDEVAAEVSPKNEGKTEGGAECSPKLVYKKDREALGGSRERPADGVSGRQA